MRNFTEAQTTLGASKSGEKQYEVKYQLEVRYDIVHFTNTDAQSGANVLHDSLERWKANIGTESSKRANQCRIYRPLKYFPTPPFDFITRFVQFQDLRRS
jgi:hypothetical protein